jgi:hypothetical protein
MLAPPFPKGLTVQKDCRSLRHPDRTLQFQQPVNKYIGFQ